MKRFLPTLVFLFSLLTIAQAETTAFKAWKIAQREVNDEAKGKLIEIFGPKNAEGVMPDTWEVLFYDPYAEQDGRLVRVYNGKVVAIEQGYTQLDQLRLAAYKLEEVMDTKRMKIDSDEIEKALNRSTPLQNIKTSNLELRLRKPDKGNVPPVWFVKIFAIQPSTGKEVKLGDARISAETGQIFELEIDTKKLD